MRKSNVRYLGVLAVLVAILAPLTFVLFGVARRSLQPANSAVELVLVLASFVLAFLALLVIVAVAIPLVTLSMSGRLALRRYVRFRQLEAYTPCEAEQLIEPGDIFCVRSDRSVMGTCTKTEQATPDRPRIIYGQLDHLLGGPGGTRDFYASEGSLELVRKGVDIQDRV